MPSEMHRDLVSRLPDVYNKDDDSNVSKFLTVVGDEIQQLIDAANQVMDARDVDKAFGVSLDNIGTNVQQSRGELNDSVYRILIKSKIARNMSQGDINTIINVLSMALGCEKSSVHLQECWNTVTEEPAAVNVQVDYRFLTGSGMSYTQFGAWVNAVVAGGVAANVLYQGSFCFSSNPVEPEIDDTKGFNAGKLGAYYDPINSPNLPL